MYVIIMMSIVIYYIVFMISMFIIYIFFNMGSKRPHGTNCVHYFIIIFSVFQIIFASF